MESFEYYLKNGSVRKVSPNKERARALLKDAESRIEDINLLNIEELTKLAFEHTYDALRDLCDAVLIAKGFKSYSHEASIVYLSKTGFDISIISQLDSFRFKRNGSKYYGQQITVSDVKEILNLFNKMKPKFDGIFKEVGIK